MCRTLNPVASKAAEGQEGQPQSKTLRATWCYIHSDRFWTAAVLLRFCLERFPRPTVLIIPVGSSSACPHLLKRDTLVISKPHKTKSPVRKRYCFWSVANGTSARMMQRLVDSARSVGVFKEF